MRRTVSLMLILSVLLVACVAAPPAGPAGKADTATTASVTHKPTATLRPTRTPVPQPYDERADAHADLAAALDASRADGKYVLIDFGANWCPDCLSLAALFEAKEIKPFLDEHYRVVHVDVGKWDKNLNLSEQYGKVIDNGIPAVVILKPDGAVVTTTADGSLANARTATVDDILSFLKEWAP